MMLYSIYILKIVYVMPAICLRFSQYLVISVGIPEFPFNLFIVVNEKDAVSHLNNTCNDWLTASINSSMFFTHVEMRVLRYGGRAQSELCALIYSRRVNFLSLRIGPASLKHWLDILTIDNNILENSKDTIMMTSGRDNFSMNKSLVFERGLDINSLHIYV